MAAKKMLALAHILNELPLTNGVESAHSSLYEIQSKPSHGPIAYAISHWPRILMGLSQPTAAYKKLHASPPMGQLHAQLYLSNLLALAYQVQNELPHKAIV